MCNHWIRRTALIVWLVLAGLWLPASAQDMDIERVLDFHSDITIHSNSTMTVTETIKVNATGDQIRRGIMRRFPTIYRDQKGHRYTVGFEVVAVKQDGEPAPHHIDDAPNGKVLYIGKEDVYIDPGVYTYTITYNTNRQLGFFRDFDELYWNVTGSGWDFPIDHASATVSLPQVVDEQYLTLLTFTGPQDSIESNASSAVNEQGEIIFETTQPLGINEGLTIVVGFPKGMVTKPSSKELARLWLKDNQIPVTAATGILLLLIYYLVTWWLVGVDPRKGNIMPQAVPPENLSPASLRYISLMRIDSLAVTAAVVALAQKGLIIISQSDNGDYTLKRSKEQPDTDLAREELTLLNCLFKHHEIMEVDRGNIGTFADAQRQMGEVLNDMYSKVYFRRNAGLISLGVVLSVVLCIYLMVLFVDRANDAAAISFFITLVVLLFLNAIFAMLLPRYTVQGRKVLDKLLGFQLALSGRHGDIKIEHPGDQQRLRRFLPYSIALGVAREWADQFSRLFPDEDRSGYTPAWYHGFERRWGNYREFSTDFSTNFSGSISSASTSPGSSSGSSGGSSGGGGGGGGGGGW